MAEFDEKLNSILSNPDAMSQIMKLAQSFSDPAPPPPRPTPEPSAPSFSGMDPGVMMKLLPLVQELGGGQDSNARRLLYALSPYLRPERQAKIDRALQLARLFHVGRQFLAKWEG